MEERVAWTRKRDEVGSLAGFFSFGLTDSSS
jgi:hypothetical protein